MKEDKIIRLSFLGDLMCTIPMTQKAKKEDKYDYKPIFENIKKYLASSQYVIGNLETPLSGADCLYTYHPTEFNTPDEFAVALAETGIDMVTTANNHSLDRGIYGLKRTISILDKVGIEHIGTQANEGYDRTLYKTFDGISCAFISYTYDTNSPWMNNKLETKDLYHINLFKEQASFPLGGEERKGSSLRKILRAIIPDFVKDYVRDKSKKDCGTPCEVGAQNNISFENKLYNDIKIAKQKVDYVFVCLHIGGQYNDVVGPYTKMIVSNCYNKGADFLICNHPHCVLPITFDERNKLTAYALGNFCNTPKWGYYVDGKYSEYSIMLHLNFSESTKKLQDVRFSILKSIENEINTQVYNVWDLYQLIGNRKERIKLENEVRNVLSRAFPAQKASVGIKEEYGIHEFLN